MPPIGSKAGAGAADDVETTLLLVGDVGATADDPVLARVAAHASQRLERTVVVFLGDNVYPDGMPTVGSEYRGRAEDLLSAQLQVGRGGAQTIFVPGNHDWDDSEVNGWDEIAKQTRKSKCSTRSATPSRLRAGGVSSLSGTILWFRGEYTPFFRCVTSASWLWLPLPIVGSLYPLIRGSGVTDQDICPTLRKATCVRRSIL